MAVEFAASQVHDRNGQCADLPNRAANVHHCVLADGAAVAEGEEGAPAVSSTTT